MGDRISEAVDGTVYFVPQRTFERVRRLPSSGLDAENLAQRMERRLYEPLVEIRNEIRHREPPPRIALRHARGS